jgi:hypothetical protein
MPWLLHRRARYSLFAAYITRAAAGIGSACGPGTSPSAGIREPARNAPRARKYRRAARPSCNGARWPARSSTAVTTGGGGGVQLQRVDWSTRTSPWSTQLCRRRGDPKGVITATAGTRPLQMEAARRARPRPALYLDGRTQNAERRADCPTQPAK